MPVTLEINVETKFTGDHEHGFDTVAEIPGTDPKLKDQIVMVGGHLDSWIAGTGATDNGAGSVVAMEAVRILKALDIKPRRTIRIALWTGEEQGLFGSKGYVKQHFGSLSLSTAPDQMQLPEFMRQRRRPARRQAGAEDVSRLLQRRQRHRQNPRHLHCRATPPSRRSSRSGSRRSTTSASRTITMRNTGGTDHLSFDAVGLPGFQFIQDPTGLRDPHPPLQHGHLRAPAPAT